MKKAAIVFSSIILIFFISCKKDGPDPGKLKVDFIELVDGYPMVIDSMKYINEAGNSYMISEIQYFISKLTIYYSDGNSYTVQSDLGIHYIDSDIEESHTWNVTDNIPAGEVDSVVFVFGMDEETNQSNIFTDPPESNMFWPEELGGGYHYMKLNGRWMDPDLFVLPFNFHLGIGQTYDTTGQVTGFIQNYFRVNPYLMFNSVEPQILPGQTAGITIYMHIDSWFRSPNTWDFNDWGGMMMQNQEALQAACENGHDAFTYKFDD